MGGSRWNHPPVYQSPRWTRTTLRIRARAAARYRASNLSYRAIRRADYGSLSCRFSKRARRSNSVGVTACQLFSNFVTNIPQAGNRWHIDCFRCNTCGTLLDSDANLLLLGDGSLICNNCTYSCSACGNKIEDLAILTGDQAFCASCFKCRNCRKKIENLRYARTSQGIFCMECHESLMARRRKKSAKISSRHKQSANSSMLLHKSLPSLPPGGETPPSEGHSETPTEIVVPTPPPPQKHSSRIEAARLRQRERSPEQERKGGFRILNVSCGFGANNLTEVLTLPSTTYRENRHSTLSLRSDGSPHGDDSFIPMKLDPTPALAPSLMQKTSPFENQGESMKPHLTETKSGSRDYFNAKVSHSSSRKASNDLEKTHITVRSESRDNSLPSSPHIAYQEKGREPSSDMLDTIRRRKEQGMVGAPNGAAIPMGSDKSRDSLGQMRSNRDSEISGEKFKLQEVPRSRKKSEGPPPSLDTFIAAGVSQSAPASATPQVKENYSTTRVPDGSSNVSPSISQDSRGYDKSSTESPVSHHSPVSTQLQNVPQRGDSLGTSNGKQQYHMRKELSGSKFPTAPLSADDGREHPASAPPATTAPQSPTALIKVNGGRTISKPMESPTSKTPPPPARARDRPGPGGDTDGETFVSPRAPPQPPFDYHKKRNASISTLQSESTVNGEPPISPKLPRYSAGGEFSMDEDMVRILGNGDHQDHASFLRRVSHSVRHARSYSDRGIRMSKDQKWPKSPLHSSTGGGLGQEISSPTLSSPETREDFLWYKNELRRERIKMVEKDQKIAELEAALDGKHNIKQMNTELKEKRSTMVVLDTQKEIVVRELEVLTEHIAAAKKSGEPLDLGSMSNTVLREFAEALQKLKETFTPQIEDLVQKRNDLIDEVSNLTQLRDKSFQEFEQFSAKNAQLADLNNQLVHQIQELYKANTVQHSMEPRPPPNGLGIYTSHQKERSNASLDSRDLRPDSQMTGSTIVHEIDTEPATILTAPQVVNIRKGQPKKFNWKKGGQNVAKGVTKGLKGAFTSNDNFKHMRDAQYPEGIPYGALPPSTEPITGTGPRPASNDPSRQGFGFFSNPKAKPPGSKGMPNGGAPVPPDGQR